MAMKYWLIVPWASAEDMVELAKHADALGFEGLMGADHGFVPQTMAFKYPYTEDGKPPIDGGMAYPEVWTTIAAMSMVTTRLKFSCAVYVLPLRHPVEVAKATGTLARLSNNRLVLGAGVGWMPEEFDAYHVDFRTRGKRMNECLEVLQLLWQGGYKEYHGEFFDFPPIAVEPAPEKPIPIILGGASKAALWRAGKYAQGWMGNGNDASEMPAIFEHLAASRLEHNRAEEEFEIILALKEFPSAEEIAAYEEQGATAMFLGFPDHTASVQTKLAMMDKMAPML